MIVEKILLLNIHFVEAFGYLLVFLATFLESAPLFGLFVPGSLVIFTGGFISKLGFLKLWQVLAFAISGAILGDLVGYIFGRYFGKEFLHKYGKYFLIKREYMDRAGDIACGHTGKALVIGRLNPITRSAAPFIVGAHKVNFWKFMFFNIIGGVLWGVLFVCLGYLFGHGYAFAQRFEKWFLVVSLLLVIGIYVIVFFKSLLEKIKNKQSAMVGECVERWA